jgi:hypothetical protein
MRFSDTIFVRRVVEAHSCDAVGFNPRMTVRHLEIDRLATHLRKLHIYGYTGRRYSDYAGIRALTRRERALISRRVKMNGKVTLAGRAILSLLLVAVDASYTLGGLRAALRFPPPAGT